MLDKEFDFLYTFISLNLLYILVFKILKGATMAENFDAQLKKAETLFLIKDTISKMLALLLPLRHQLLLINKNIDNFSVSDVYYVDFLKRHMQNEYVLYKKNCYFSKNSKKIIDVLKVYKNPLNQFNHIDLNGEINGSSWITIDVEDYIYFMNKYYDQYVYDIYENMQDIEY